VRATTIALAALLGCRSPDGAAIEPYVERTNYPSSTSEWDSHGYGVGFSLAWDLGRRAEANEAAIQDHEILVHQKIEAERPSAVVAGCRDAVGSLDASDASVAGTLLAAFLAFINRKPIAAAGRAVVRKVRRKKTDEQ
jgi:hypothetical protein